ncbi:hypothetical protein B0H14DRAFT_2627483 [Mycena olivaceomarginata]|nr:hypothetical protein B0H14DRAFT_2627483 [Mycena olivaceomarginata]
MQQQNLRDDEDAHGDGAEGANLRAHLLQMAGGVVVLQVRYREHKNEEEHKGERRGGREEEKKLAVRETTFAFLDEERESAEVRGYRRNSTVKVVSFADGEGTEGEKKERDAPARRSRIRRRPDPCPLSSPSHYASADPRASLLKWHTVNGYGGAYIQYVNEKDLGVKGDVRDKRNERTRSQTPKTRGHAHHAPRTKEARSAVSHAGRSDGKVGIEAGCAKSVPERGKQTEDRKDRTEGTSGQNWNSR